MDDPHAHATPAISTGGDYVMCAYTGEMVKIMKTAKGLCVPPGTRLAELVDRKEFLRGQVAHWKLSILVPEDNELSHQVIFVSVVLSHSSIHPDQGS